MGRELWPVTVFAALFGLCACGEPPVDNAALAADVQAGRADEVTAQGTVTQLLPDSQSNDGRHERFDVDFGQGVLVEIDHNVSLAPRVPVTTGNTITVHGQFEPDPGHSVIHYTHHATGRHEGGWIDLNGQRYQ